MLWEYEQQASVTTACRVYDHYNHYYRIYDRILDRDWLSNHNREFCFADCFLKGGET